MGAAPLVAPNAPFKAGLAAARPAPTALAPLRHDRGLQAPAGLVAGIATPVQRATDPVPGSVRRPAGPARSTTADAAAPEGAWRLSDTSAPESTVWPAFGSEAVAGPAPSPLLRAPAVAPAPGAPPLTRASLAGPVPAGRVGSRPTVAREAATPGRAPVAAPTAAASATAAADVGPPAAAMASETRSTAVPLAGGAAGPVAGVPVSRSLDTARPNLGQSRRLRVGAAITPVSGSPIGVQRSAAEPAAGTAAAGGDRPALPSPAQAAASPGGAPAGAGLPVARELDGAAGVAAEGEAGLPGVAAAGPAVARAAATEAGSVPLRLLTAARSADGPLVGTLRPHINPASPAVAVHVQLEAAGGPAEDEGSPVEALAALARMDQTAGIGQAGAGSGTTFGAPSALFPGAGATSAGRSAIDPGWAGPSPTVARSMVSPPAPSPAPAGGPSGRASTAAPGRTITRGALGASPMPPPALQRTMSWDPVNGLTTSGDPAPSLAPVGAAPAASAVPAPAAAAGSPPLPAIAPLVARSIDDAGPGSVAAVQREEAAAAPAGQAGGAAAPAGGGAMPEAQLDDLARRLHDKIAARLSRDLLIERERSGSLIDRGW